MAKATDAFRNIGEVSVELGVRKHVLRFWEAKFPQLKPMKRGGGRRYYRPTDVQLLRGIRHLLQTAGYTIKGVQKILREQGTEDVKKLADAAAARRDEKGRAATIEPPSKSAPPRELTGAEMKALREVAVTLEAVHALLADAHKTGTSSDRQKRAARD